MVAGLSLTASGLVILSQIILVQAEPAPRVVSWEFEKRAAHEVGGKLLRRGPASADLFNAQGDLLYLVNATVGTPPQTFSLQLDTGSSDIWLPSVSATICSVQKRCGNGAFDETKSSSYKLLDANDFQISYVDGTRIRGDYISDNFQIGGVTIKGQTLGLARSDTQQDSNNDFQGICGVGFETGEAIYGQTGQTYKNLVSMLKDTGSISTRTYSLWLNDMDNGKGSILFGGVDTEKYHGDLTMLPIQPDADSGSITSFTVALDNMNVLAGDGSKQYGQTNLAMPVILDSGTTLTYLPTKIAQDLYTGVGAVNSGTFGVVVPCDLMYSPATLNFGFGNPGGPVISASISEFVLPFPPSVPTPHFRSSGKAACRWGIQDAGDRPNLFGDTFLRSAYVVYNLDTAQIGIASTNFNTTKSNVQEIKDASAIPGASKTATGAAKQTATGLFGTAGIASIGSGPSQVGANPTGTFNLGSPTASSTSNSKSGAGHQLQPPSKSITFALTAGAGVLLAMLGGSMIIFF